MAKVSNKGSSGSSKKSKIPLKRVKKEIPSPSKKGSSGPSINVVGFGEPFTLELYWYEKNQRQDGFIDSLRRYINSAGSRIHDEDALTHSGVDGANFTEVIVRRVPRSEDETMFDGEYPRFLIVRYLNGPSTPETRQVGLGALKSFLMDGRFQRFPIANSVPTVDQTFEGAALDEYPPPPAASHPKKRRFPTNFPPEKNSFELGPPPWSPHPSSREYCTKDSKYQATG